MKRRNFVIGMSLLATGSGALTVSGAFGNEQTEPTADFRVLSDVLRVEAHPNAGDETNINYTSSPGDFGDGTFDRDNLPQAELNDDENGDLLMRVGIETRSSETFGPLLQVVNDTSVDYNVGFNYADPSKTDASNDPVANLSDSELGYGDDVDGGDGSPIGAGDVNDIFQFQDESSNTISPPPGSNDGTANASVGINSGESHTIKLIVDTTGYTGDINSAAGTDGTWAKGEAQYVDLLDQVWVGAEEQQ